MYLTLPHLRAVPQHITSKRLSDLQLTNHARKRCPSEPAKQSSPCKGACLLELRLSCAMDERVAQLGRTNVLIVTHWHAVCPDRCSQVELALASTNFLLPLMLDLPNYQLTVARGLQKLESDSSSKIRHRIPVETSRQARTCYQVIPCHHHLHDPFLCPMMGKRERSEIDAVVLGTRVGPSWSTYAPLTAFVFADRAIMTKLVDSEGRLSDPRVDVQKW